MSVLYTLVSNISTRHVCAAGRHIHIHACRRMGGMDELNLKMHWPPTGVVGVGVGVERASSPRPFDIRGEAAKLVEYAVHNMRVFMWFVRCNRRAVPNMGRTGIAI